MGRSESNVGDASRRFERGQFQEELFYERKGSQAEAEAEMQFAA
jgi:hypothetical protein